MFINWEVGLLPYIDISVNILTVILCSYIAETLMDHVAGALKKGRIKDLLIF